MRLLALLRLCLPAALAGTGGPDAGGTVYTDSGPSDGPSYAGLDTSGGLSASLADDDSLNVELPFDFEFYGTSYSSVDISSNGAVFFDGVTTASAGACPPSAVSYTGIAAFWDDLGASTITYDTFGTYPYRTFAVTWQDAPHAVYGGAATFQIWLLEGRNEAVVQFDDVTFGDPAVDGGASAVVGSFAGPSGLPWSCSATFGDGTSVWFGAETARPAREEVYADELEDPWEGAADFNYVGTSMWVTDLNSDGEDDVIVGASGYSEGAAYVLYRPWTTPGTLDGADASFEGPSSGSLFGTTIGAGDMDGDGTPELGFGAPGADVPGSDSGAAYLFEGASFSGVNAASSAGIIVTGNSTGRPGLGTSVSLDGDFNGDGYADLLVTAPGADDGGSDAGAAYIFNGSATVAGTYTTTSATSRITGAASGDKMGTTTAVGDLDSDGLDDFVIGAPGSDAGATNGGAAFVVYGADLPSGAAGITTLATCRTMLAQAGAALGTSVAIADAGGGTGLDLLLGAPYYDSSSTDIGAVYAMEDVGTTCRADVALADMTYLGQTASGRFGSAIEAGDLDGDGTNDLAIAASNDNTYTSGGGVVYTYTTPPSASTVTAADADHSLFGTWGGGRAGSALQVAGGSNGQSLIVTAPYASGTFSSAGVVFDWVWHEDFEDDDSDGFVNAEAGGNDCDDSDANAYPGGTDTYADSADGDCDGWVDGEIRVRRDAEDWSWDLDEMSATVSTTLDFESSTAGDALTTLGGVTFSGTTFDDQTSRTYPSGSVGVTVSGGTLTMEFDAPVDALALRWLDPEDDFTLTAYDDTGATVVAAYDFELDAASRTGGVYRGYVFVSSISTIVVDASTGDTFGFDDLEIVDAADTDRDLDGQTEAAGDCDDTDASVYVGASEVLDNGIDDDCDGIVDGGDMTTWTDLADWSTAAGITSETIDFEDLTATEAIDSQYTSLGATFDGTPVAATAIDGSAPNGALAAQAVGSTLSMEFTELQPAVALTFIDLDTTATIEGYVGSALVYTASFTGSGSSDFMGLTTEYGFDRLDITVASDTFGADDVIFSALGLDDADGDGMTEAEGDCDDADATTYLGADETWYDGVDSDCAGDDDYDADADGVEYSADCDDTDAAVNPAATETWYDGVDSDCDGASDYDQDGDGFESDASGGGEDCDDSDATVNPDATEIWYDGVDSDCDEADDYDADGDGYSVGSGLGGDCDDGDAAVSPAESETYYDGVDNDCDEATDDEDQDGDGYTSTSVGGDDCDDSNASAHPDATGDVCYDGVDTDCDGANDYDCDADGYSSDAYGGDDCDDADDAVNPSAADTMGDGVDTDCDSGAEYDFDYDGYDGELYGGTDCNDADDSVYLGAPDTCYDGVDSNCDEASDSDCDVDGYDAEALGGLDCDDTDATINPGEADFPYDGIDNDCDGGSEYDVDGDGYTSDWYGGDDCDDGDSTIYPGAMDACYDGEDTDCGSDDDYDCDADLHTSDAWGGDDCDDADAAISPDATEISGDGIDQDCDGIDPVVCTDCDGDGYDASASGGDDCEDADASVNPGATDAPYDGIDADCGGDDDFDVDSDGDRAALGGGADCDDNNPLIASTNTLDDCGNGDEDCDGDLDDDCGDTGDTDDSGDSGETGDTDTGTSDSGDSGEDWRPEAEDVTAPREIERGTACGCDSGDAGAGALGLLLVAAGLARRKRA